MAEAQPDDIQERLVSLCALIPGVETSEAWWMDDHKPFVDAELAAIIINPAPSGTNQFLSGSEYTGGQDWFLNCLIKRFPYDYKLRDRETWGLIRPFMRTVADFFNEHRYLELNDAGIVRAITLPSLYSLTPSTLDRALYASVGLRMTTFTIHGY